MLHQLLTITDCNTFEKASSFALDPAFRFLFLSSHDTFSIELAREHRWLDCWSWVYSYSTSNCCSAVCWCVFAQISRTPSRFFVSCYRFGRRLPRIYAFGACRTARTFGFWLRSLWTNWGPLITGGLSAAVVRLLRKGTCSWGAAGNLYC